MTPCGKTSPWHLVRKIRLAKHTRLNSAQCEDGLSPRLNTTTHENRPAPGRSLRFDHFFSAFLLFQVQPLIGKMILPWFGGSAAVWTTCMLFFQSVLLLGYFYSHWVTRFLRPSRQSLVHGSLLLISLLFIPIGPSLDRRPIGAENPTLRILGLLAVSIGLPYFVLSTTGPLLQA